jgi:N utilization substance protein B
MMYELDVGKHSKEEILRTYWLMNEHPEKVREFADQLFEGTVKQLKEIDKVIQQHTKNWRLSRMAVVDRNVLRPRCTVPPGTKTPRRSSSMKPDIARKFSTQDSAQFETAFWIASKTINGQEAKEQWKARLIFWNSAVSNWPN